MEKMEETPQENGLPAVTYTYRLPLSETLRVTVRYAVQSDGSVLVSADYPGAKGLPELPLFGLQLHLPPEFEYFTYYGYGPEENYRDRDHGARLGLFEGRASENLSKYVMPQECGNRTGVRFAEVVNDEGHGIRLTAKDAPFELNVLPYTPMELEHAMHLNELPPAGRTVVSVIAKQMGVGGDDSWGAPVHPQYCIDSGKPIHLSFILEVK